MMFSRPLHSSAYADLMPGRDNGSSGRDADVCNEYQSNQPRQTLERTNDVTNQPWKPGVDRHNAKARTAKFGGWNERLGVRNLF